MDRRRLPDLVVVVVLAATFVVGWMLPLTADPHVGFSIGWLAAILGLVIIDPWLEQ